MGARQATQAEIRISLAQAGASARRVGVTVRNWGVKYASPGRGESALFERWNPVRQQIESRRLMLFTNAELNAFIEGMEHAFSLVAESQRPTLSTLFGDLEDRGDPCETL